MLPLLSLHALAAQRGDGLRPELKTLLERHAGVARGLSATIEPVEAERENSNVETQEAGRAQNSQSTDDCLHATGSSD